MFEGYCSNCDEVWSNATPNCPECGQPDPNAKGEFEGGVDQNGGSRPKRRAKRKSTRRKAVSSGDGGFRGAAVEAMKLGATMAVASEANNAIKEMSKKALVKAGVPELMLEESVLFNKGVPLASSILILWLSENFPELVPKNEMVSKASQLALSQATIETIQPLIKQVTPTLMALAASGEKLAALEAANNEEESEAEIVEIDTEKA